MRGDLLSGLRENVELLSFDSRDHDRLLSTAAKIGGSLLVAAVTPVTSVTPRMGVGVADDGL